VLSIPKIGVEQVVLAGTDTAVLAEGPGILAGSSFPGTPGNATIAGHRTTYGGPFRRLDELAPGDRIEFSAPGEQDAVFEVRGVEVVSPSASQVAAQTPGVRLTLVTCDPPGSTARRLVVQAELVSGTYEPAALPVAGWQFSS
jgi:sortase A